MTVDLEGLDQTDVCLVLEAFRQRLRFMGPAHPNAGRMQLLIDRMEMAQLAAADRVPLGGDVEVGKDELEQAIRKWKDGGSAGLLSADGEALAAAGFGMDPERGEPRFEMKLTDVRFGSVDVIAASREFTEEWGRLRRGVGDLASCNCRCSDGFVAVTQSEVSSLRDAGVRSKG